MFGMLSSYLENDILSANRWIKIINNDNKSHFDHNQLSRGFIVKAFKNISKKSKANFKMIECKNRSLPFIIITVF